MKLLFLANPSAAGRRARPLLPALRDAIARQAAGFDYHESNHAADLRRQAEVAAHAGYDRVLVAGGDGSAHAAVNALRGSQTALGVIPLGHGNDLARALDVPLEPLAAVDYLLKAPVVSMDLARVGNIVYGCVAGVGLDAATNRRANAWRGRLTGHTRYFLTALYTLASYWAVRIELTSDTESFSGEVMWVAIANTPNYGGGLRIAPQARLDDGLLDVCIIKRIATPTLLRLYPALLRGTHLQSPHVRYFRAARVRLAAPVGADLYGDGEFLARLPLEIGIAPAGLRVLGRLP